MRAFLDTNVIISAVISERGIARELWRLSQAGKLEMVASRLAADESLRNIQEKAHQKLVTYDLLMLDVEIVPRSTAVKSEWGLDYADSILLATALANGATHFVTGDKHFDPLKDSLTDIRIVTIREMLIEIEGELQA